MEIMIESPLCIANFLVFVCFCIGVWIIGGVDAWLWWFFLSSSELFSEYLILYFLYFLRQISNFILKFDASTGIPKYFLTLVHQPPDYPANILPVPYLNFLENRPNIHLQLILFIEPKTFITNNRSNTNIYHTLKQFL